MRRVSQVWIDTENKVKGHISLAHHGFVDRYSKLKESAKAPAGRGVLEYGCADCMREVGRTFEYRVVA